MDPLLGHFGLFLFYHCLELNVYFDALQLVVCFSLGFHFPDLVLFGTTCVSIKFDLINALHCGLLFL